MITCSKCSRPKDEKEFPRASRKCLPCTMKDNAKAKQVAKEFKEENTKAVKAAQEVEKVAAIKAARDARNEES